MFHSDSTFVLALIAVSLASFFILFAKIRKEESTKVCIGVGYVVLVLSVIMVLISGYHMVKECMMKRHMMKMMHQQRQAVPMQQMQKSNVRKPGKQNHMHHRGM